jgi:hypothetical protein
MKNRMAMYEIYLKLNLNFVCFTADFLVIKIE